MAVGRNEVLGERFDHRLYERAPSRLPEPQRYVRVATVCEMEYVRRNQKKA